MDISTHNGNNHALAALLHIIQTYVIAVTPTLVLTLSCRSSHTCNFFSNIIGNLYPGLSDIVLQLLVIPENATLHVHGNRLYNLMMVDSYKAFADIDAIWYTKDYNFNEYYLIFLHTRNHNFTADMRRIFEYCWRHYLINCNVLVQVPRGEIYIYTYFPFMARSCGHVVPVLVNEFNGTALVVEELFQRKLQNMHGCTLTAALWDVPPFLYLQTDARGVSHVVGGFEGQLLHELSTLMNFKVAIKIPPNDEQRGRFIRNEWNGALGMMHRRAADFSLGCFRQTAPRDGNATSVVNYYQSAEVISISKLAYNFTSLEILFFPFNIYAWLLLFFTSFLNIFVEILMNLHLESDLKPRNNILTLLLILTGMPVPRAPTRQHSRIYFSSWLLFTLVWRTMYQALLFHFIRTHVMKRLPESFDELVKENFTVVMNRGTYDALEDIDFLHQLHSKLMNSTLEMVAFDYVANTPRRRLAAAGPVDFLMHYVYINKKAGIMKVLPQDIINLQITMYLTKHSFLIDQFEDEIRWMRSAGLIDVWVRWELQKTYFQSKRHEEDHVFGMQELESTFVLYFAGLGIAMLVFFIELLSALLRSDQ